ncbi:sugar phosphate nucleotidyltransferase [Candidatus Poriferisodalis sp.]|uniref:sugar phosphate nucleotidyltransferase n=1 Tax=Candidatus Poriferisodalis sp. TaxID=3101277 RepID=UPI003B026764
MKAVLLLGGLGTRLRPLTADRPKQMLPVCGRPMIEWVCEHLARHGVTDVVLSLGYRPEAFTEAYPDGKIGRLRFEVAVEPEPAGTAGAVRFAATAAQLSETFLVLNADVLTDLDVSALVQFHVDSGAQASIALQPVDDPSAYGLVLADTMGRVHTFAEKPGPGSAILRSPDGSRPTISAGTYVLEPTVVERIPPGRAVSIEREVFPALVADGTMCALAEDTYWLDTGTPQQYLAANLDILEGRRPNARVGDEASMASDGFDPRSRVRASVIGANCSIGPDAVVVRSVLMDGCEVGPGAVIADSVLASDVVIGAEALVTQNSVVGRGERIESDAVVTAVRVPPA